MVKVLQVFTADENHDLVHVSTHESLDGAKERAKGLEKNPPKAVLQLSDYWVMMTPNGKSYEFMISDLEMEK